MNVVRNKQDSSCFDDEWKKIQNKIKNRLKPWFYFYHFKENSYKIAFLALILLIQWPIFGQNIDMLRFRVLDSLLLINLFFSQLVRISWGFIAY